MSLETLSLPSKFVQNRPTFVFELRSGRITWIGLARYILAFEAAVLAKGLWLWIIGALSCNYCRQSDAFRASSLREHRTGHRCDLSRHLQWAF
jgi:hypothetical protein